MPGNIQTADQVGEFELTGDVGSLPFFDTSAFAQPTGVRFGDTGRNAFRGRGQQNLDLSIFRGFRLGGNRRLEVRAEGFNMTNTGKFNIPNQNERTVGNAHLRPEPPRDRRAASVSSASACASRSSGTSRRNTRRRPTRTAFRARLELLPAGLFSFLSAQRRSSDASGIQLDRIWICCRRATHHGCAIGGGASGGPRGTRQSSAAAAQPAPAPALPVITLDSFPAAARAAIADAHREAAARPDDAAAVGRLGMVLHAWEQWQSAAMAYERARMLAPRDSRLAVSRGRRRTAHGTSRRRGEVARRRARDRGSGRRRAAGSKAAAAEARATASLPMRMKLAEALVNAGDLTRGAEAYARLVKEPAAQPEAEYGLGRIAALKGDWKGAIAHQQRACELFPEFGAAHYALGLAYRNAGRLDDAQRELELHRRYGPRWPAIDDPVLAKVHALKDDARANLERGIRLGNEGKIAEAIAAHDAALVERSRQRAGPRESDLAARTPRSVGRRGETLQGRRRVEVESGRGVLQLRRRAHAAEARRGSGGRLPPRDRRQSAARAGAQQSRRAVRTRTPLGRRGGRVPARDRESARVQAGTLQSRDAC